MGMKIKKFRAPTLQKALEEIRQEMGDGAIILQADPVKDGKFGRNAVEVTAATERADAIPRFSYQLSDEEAEREAVEKTPSSKPHFFSGLFKRTKTAETLQAKKPKTKSAKRKSEKKPDIQKFIAQASQASGQKGAEVNTSGQIYAMKSYLEPLQKEMKNLKEMMLAEQKNAKVQRAPSTALIESEIQTLKKMFSHFMDEQKYQNDELPDSYRRLLNFWKSKGMTEIQIRSFFRRIEEEGLQLGSEESQQFIKPILSQRIREARTTENPKQKVVTLLGPTGVGKTTTIAKLAAYEKLKLHRTVALVTIDDYKIGGTDQLSHYARILEVPFIKVRSDLSLEEQIKHLNVDTIFIDTYGLAPRDEKKILEMRKALHFKDAALRGRLEKHLVLPVGVASGDIENIIESFETLSPEYLLFTKWDETQNWGGMLAAILESSHPVSFVGHGQEVPNDLTIFSSRNFVETITGIEQ